MSSVTPISLLLSFVLGGTILLGVLIMILLLRSDLGFCKWLISILLLGLLLHLLTFWLFITELILEWPYLLGVGTPLLFSLGPAFYFFVHSYADPRFRFKWRHLPHTFIPFGILIFVTVDIFTASLESKLTQIAYYYELVPQGQLGWQEWFFFNFYVLILLLYTLAAVRYINRNRPYNSRLLRRFCWLLLSLSLVYLFLQSGFILSGASLITSEIILSCILALAVLIMGYWILDIRQLLPKAADNKKYRTSPLSGQERRKIEQSLLAAMEGQEMYLNPRLKVDNLARELKIPSHHLSQVLNSHMGVSFYQLVNRYRVRRSQQMLQSDRLKQFSIQAIGLECGFSNKSSFFRAFKQHTGMTPAEYVSQKRASA